ncbi:hypothetical protein IKO70_10905 [bacterium]|nr:hypothetical protein [bacterium]
MQKICIVLVLFCAFFKMFADDDEKLKLAVMDFEDLSGKLSEDVLIGASEYFRVIFAQTNRYIIISKDRQKEQIGSLRKKYNTDPTYKSCTDKNCQIQLGQALSADLIVKTSVSFFAGSYTLASELIDLEKEATIIAATEECDGSPKDIKNAINNLVKKIVDAEKKENSEPAPAAPAYREQPQQQQMTPIQSKDYSDCENATDKASAAAWETYLRKHPNGVCAKEAKNFLDGESSKKELDACEKARKKSTEKGWKNYLEEFPEGQCAAEGRNALDSMACSTAENDGSLKGWKEYLDNYPNGKCSTKAKENLGNQENIGKLMKKGRDMKISGATLLAAGTVGLVIGISIGVYQQEKAEGEMTSKALTSFSVSTAIGGTMILTGIPLLIVGVLKEKEAKSYIELNNVSVLPTKGGAYASLGFSF